MRKILLLSLMLIGNCLWESCCCKEDNICFDLDLTGIKNFNLDENYSPEGIDTIKVNSYAILFESKTIDRTCFIDFSMGGSLYAFQCDGPFYLLKDIVTNISIKSNAHLSSKYIAGSELKDLFSPVDVNKSCLALNVDSISCVRDHFNYLGVNSLEAAFNDIMAPNFYVDNIDLLNLFLMKTNEIIIENNHRFTIKFDFKSGKTIELTTPEIRII